MSNYRGGQFVTAGSQAFEDASAKSSAAAAASRQYAATTTTARATNPSTAAYKAGKAMYGSSSKWYDAALEEEKQQSQYVTTLKEQLEAAQKQSKDRYHLTAKQEDEGKTVNRPWMAENWDRNTKSVEELQKELSAAEAKLKNAQSNLEYATEWRHYDADMAWLDNVNNSQQSWDEVSRALNGMQQNIEQKYAETFAALEQAKKENEMVDRQRRQGGLPTEVGLRYTNEEELAKMEAQLLELSELNAMASRRYGYSLDKIGEDKKAIERGKLRADHIATMAEQQHEAAMGEYVQTHVKGDTLGAVRESMRNDRSDYMPTDLWSDEQLNRYYALLGSGRDEEANLYAVNVNTYNNATEAEKKTKSWYEWGYAEDANGWGKTARGLAGTAAVVATAPGQLGSYLNKVERVAATGVYTGSAKPGAHDYAQALTQGRADSLNELGTIGGKGLGDLYQLTNSMAQSLVYANTVGAAGTMAIFFGQAADQGFDDALARGATGEQASVFGFMSGVAEAAAEYIPLDNLLNADKAMLQGFLKSTLIQAGMEGTEEGVTSVLNTMADAIVNGDKSAISLAVQQRMANGESYDEATRAEWNNYIKDVMWDVVGGAISGAGSSVIQQGVNMVKPYTDTYGVDAEQLGKEAAASSDEALAKRGNEVQKIAENGGTITNYTAQKMVKQTNRASMVDAVEQQINERGENVKDARMLANAIVSKSRGERVTKNYQALMDKHSELSNTLLQELGSKKTAPTERWAKEIGVRGKDAVKYGYREDREVWEKRHKVEETVLTGGEYAEARSGLIEKGQNKIEYTDDFDFVADVYGNSNNYKDFDAVWADIQQQGTVLTEAQARAAWEAGQAKLSTADTKGKIKGRGTGAVRFEAVKDGDTEYSAPSADEIESFKRSARYEYLAELAKQVGVDIVFFKGGAEDINGKYMNGTVYLAVDASPSVRESVNGYVMLTAAHELTHYIKEASPARYAELKDFVTKHLIEKGKMDGKSLKDLIIDKRKAYAVAGVNLSVDAAIEELVADACEMMLKDNSIVAKMKAENETLWGMISRILNELMAKVKAAFEGLEAHHTEAQAMMDSFKELQEIWNLGLTEASQAEVTGEFAPGSDGVVVDEAGEPVAMSTAEGSVQLSIKTYEDSGREAFRKYLDKCIVNKKLTETEAEEMRNGIEEIYKVCKKFKDKYAPFSSWSEAEVIRDTYGKPVFSVVTPNGDYKMNLDFSLVCRKRRTLDAVFNEMSKRGIIDDFELGQKSVVRINEIIRKYNFETACALCFVDAKRFRQAAMADSFVSLYNELVKSLVPADRLGDITHFNFAGNEGFKKAEAGKQGIDTWNNSELDFSHLRDVMKNYGKGTVEHKAAKYIMEHAEGRKLLFRGDFMSSGGFDAVKIGNKNILKLYNSKKGTGGPKAAFGDVQYMNEILSKDRSWTPGKAYDVGGVRVQSFSDYVPRMVFDYVQMIYDLAAAKLPAHAYTKEALFVKQFGLTGIKINMSLIPAVVKDGIAAGLDANGNYVWAGESFNYNTAIEVQNAEGYTENCGTICVGVSNEHIRKLLDDPNIRMVIPYHKSGLNPIVAHMNKVAAFTDYTNDQRTKDSNGKAIAKDFDFNKQLHKMGAEGDPKAVAQMYLDWCADNGYTPKFAEFAESENYYKLLIDFTVYDRGGKYVPQREVRGVFPNEKSAFNSMAELIKSGLEEDAIIEGSRTEKIGSIVDEIVNTLPKTEAEIAEVEIEQAEGDVEADAVNRSRYSLRDAKMPTRADLEKKDPIKAVDISAAKTNGSFAQRRKQIRKDAEKIITKPYLNADTKTLIFLTERSYTHLFNNLGELQLNAAEHLPEFIERAVLTHAEKPTHGSEYANGVYTFFAAAKTDHFMPVKLKVKEYDYAGQLLPKNIRDYFDNNPQEYASSYDTVVLEVEEIEKSPSGSVRDIKEYDVAPDPEELYTIKVTDLLNLVKGKARKYIPQLYDSDNVLDPRNLKSADPDTYDDEGNVIPLSERFKKDNLDIRYSIKDEAMSDRMILANALMELAETDAEKAKLTEYQQMVDKLDETQVKLDLAEKELNKAYRLGDKDAIAKAQKERDKLGARLSRADRALVTLQATKPMKDLLTRAKRDTRYKTQRRMRETATVNKYRERVYDKVDTLTKWLVKNSDREHVPEALKAPLIDFLSSIDLRSKQMLKKGTATEVDRKYIESAEKLRKIAAAQQKYLQNGDPSEMLDNFLDLGDLPDVMENHVESIRAILGGDVDVNTDSAVMKMNAEQLQDLDHILTVLTTSIRKANKFLGDSHYASVIEAAKAGMAAVNSLRGEDVSQWLGKEAADKFFAWSNTIPYYAFKRFGEAGSERFAAFITGWSKMAQNIAEIKEYTAEAYTEEEVKAWESTLHEFEFNGVSFKMTEAQIMGLYLSNMREQAVKHIDKGGIRIGNIQMSNKAGIKTSLVQKDTIHLLPSEITEVLNVLTPRHIEVAAKLSKFLNTTCSEWGNEVSMERFGYRQFTEDSYYPIKSVETNMDLKDKAAEETDLFRLINMSATKALNPNANNAILINSVFDVFAAHTADMAKYNGLALPVLDMVKWYNWRDKTITKVTDTDGSEHTHIETASMHKSIEAAFGRNATEYISHFIKDLNGVRSGGRSEGMLKGAMGRYKAAAVALNTRVIVQQPTSIVRASYMINPKYLMRGAAMKGGAEEAMEYSGLAQWKSMGFFDTNIARGITEQIKHSATAIDKLKDKSMEAAGKADEMTWGAIWNACKLEVQEKTGAKGETLKLETAKRFNEIIVATQVMDSTITRSDLMRSDSLMMKELTSFKSEPTVTYNMMLDSVMELILEKKRTGSLKAARQKAWPIMGRAFAVYVTSQLATAAAAAIIDALRDDDEYQSFLEKWLEHVGANFKDNVNPLGLLPILPDMVNVLLGKETPESMLFQPLTQLQKGTTAAADMWKLWFNSDAELNDPRRTNWGRLYQIAQAASSLTGVPVAAGMREAKMLWNMSGRYITGKKLVTYDSGAKNEIKYALEDGYLTEEEAVNLLIKTGEYTEAEADDAYWQVQEWVHADDSEWTRYNDVYSAVLAGDAKAFEVAVDALGDHGIPSKSVKSKVKSEVGKWFVGGEDVTHSMDEKTALKALTEFAGMIPIEAQHYLDELKFQKETGVRWADLKAEYVAGTFKASDVKTYLVKYGHEYSKDADEKVKEWTCEKDTGFAYSELSNYYVDGELSEKDALKYLQQYGGLTAAEAETKVLAWDAIKDLGIKLGSSTAGIKKQLIEGYISEETAIAAMMKYDGKTREEAEDYVNQYKFTEETGYAWSEVEEAFADGIITEAELTEWYMVASSTARGSEEIAKELVEVAKWKRDVEGAEKINRDALAKWDSKGEYYMTGVGLGKEDFADAWALYSAAKAQYDSSGNKTKEKAQVFFEQLYALYQHGVYNLDEVKAIAKSIYSSSYIRKYAPW